MWRTQLRVKAPAASMRDSDDRQALVDAIFATGDNPTPARP